MNTRVVVEELLYQFPSLKVPLLACRVLNKDSRDWKAKEHKEISNYINKFKSPSIICVIGIIITVFIIEPKPNNRVYTVIQINGKNTKLKNLSKGKIIEEALKCLNINDFLPRSLTNQIYWIPYSKGKKEKEIIELEILKTLKEKEPETIDMLVFSEISNGVWSINKNIDTPIVENSIKTTKKEILKNIFSEF